jgi:hypothetical protein
MPAYGMEDLFADIGGTLGLWMGVSVLTVMELLELVVRLSYLFCRAEWRPGGPSLPKDGSDDDGTSRGRSPPRTFREMTEAGDRGAAREPTPYRDREHCVRRGGGVQDSDGEGGRDAYRLTDIRSTQGYSYRSEADYRRGSEYEHHSHPNSNPPTQSSSSQPHSYNHPRQELYTNDANGRHAGSSSSSRGASGPQQPRTEYSGRTKYWRLKKPTRSNR